MQTGDDLSEKISKRQKPGKRRRIESSDDEMEREFEPEEEPEQEQIHPPKRARLSNRIPFFGAEGSTEPFPPFWRQADTEQVDEALWFRPSRSETTFGIPDLSVKNHEDYRQRSFQFQIRDGEVPILFHYTNPAGLKGILESGKVFYSEHQVKKHPEMKQVVADERKRMKRIRKLAQSKSSRTKAKL